MTLSENRSDVKERAAQPRAGERTIVKVWTEAESLGPERSSIVFCREGGLRRAACFVFRNVGRRGARAPTTTTCEYLFFGQHPISSASSSKTTTPRQPEGPGEQRGGFGPDPHQQCRVVLVGGSAYMRVNNTRNGSSGDRGLPQRVNTATVT